MFLKSIELYGFKSFADRTKFEFSDGITSLLGPNGSGKSNVVDAIKWVLGTQALSQLRAGKKEDVIFNGTDLRKMMPMCEVILTLNNEENILSYNSNEIELKRRMFRSGENEYFINRDRVLLKDVKDLFLDTGVGKSAYSILEQGKIDQILSLKPEDRRYIFEEAAGISKFKIQSEDASRKLQKTEENLSQVELIYHEQEKILNSRKYQLEKVLKNRELNEKRESLEVDLQLSYVQALSKLYSVREQDLKSKEDEFSEIENLLNEKRSDLSDQQLELDNLRTSREKLNGNIYRTEEQILGFNRESDIYNERYREISQRTKEAALKAVQYEEKLRRDRLNLEEKEETLSSLKDNVEIIKSSISKSLDEISEIKVIKDKYYLQIKDIESDTDKLSQYRLEITNKISAIANDIADKLQKNIEGSGYSSVIRSKNEKQFFEELRKLSTLIKERSNFLIEISKVNFDKNVFVEAIEEAEENLTTEVDEIKGLFQEYSGSIPTFLDDFVSPEGILASKSKLDFEISNSYSRENDNKLKIRELTSEIDRQNNLLILKESDLSDLNTQQTQYLTKIESLSVQVSEMRDAMKQSEFDFTDASLNIKAEKEKEKEAILQVERIKEKIKSLNLLISQYKEDLEQINIQIDAKSLEISQHNSDFQSKFERKQELMTDIAAGKANLVSLNESIQKVYTDFFDETGKSLKEFNNHEIVTPVDELKSDLDSVKKKIQDLGYINFMAEEEYNEAKKNFDFYQKNLDDLTKAKNDLEFVISEIKTKSENLFNDTFNQINDAFSEMFSTLFGGGSAKLRLEDPENVLSCGIEIQAQPPGKKMTWLPALSGGEKSMTAVALLFATYKVKPSPFCILDEIDAALDAKNIGSFMQVLDKFGGKSQFIIITHNKNTVLGSDCLLGVTQEEAGVSKMIGYKLNSSKDESNTEATLKG